MKKPKPINVGICSYGMSGRVFHTPFLDCLEEFNLRAVTERSTRNAVKRYPDIKTYTSVEDMLLDDKLELVVVNTPNVTHFDYAKKALESGKHVVVEKPFAATYKEGKQLAEIAAQNDKLLVVYQNRRWDSDFQSVCEVVKEKKLGKLIEAEFHYDRYRMEPSAKTHKEKPEKGVGLIYDLGPHLIDQGIALFGKPQAVFARVQKNRPGSQVDDYFTIHLLYEDFNCVLKSSLLVKEQGPGYILHGTKGSFLKSRADVQEADLIKEQSPCADDWGNEPASEKGLLHTTIENKEVHQFIAAPKGDYKFFFKRLYQSIREKKPSPVALKDSLLNMQIIEAALDSQENNSVINIE